MPVYNGEPHLTKALQSLLIQDYENFELIISDNASTDATSEICRACAANDKRIRYYRNETNIGAVENFKRVFHLSSSRYFIWAAHDDLWHPSYIRKCIEGLEKNPEAVLAYSDIEFIDERGSRLDIPYHFDASGQSIARRVMAMAATKGDILGWYEIYGMIRSECLGRTRLPMNVFGSDVILLMELCLLGPFVRIPEILFHYRIVWSKSIQEQYEQLGSEKQSPLVQPYSGLCRELLGVISHSNLNTITKANLRFAFITALYFKNPLWINMIRSEKRALLKSYLRQKRLVKSLNARIVIWLCDISRAITKHGIHQENNHANSKNDCDQRTGKPIP